MLLVKRDNIPSYEQQAKFILNRIAFTEKSFKELCAVLTEYLQKISKVRDKTDEVTKVILTFAESENVNKTLSNGLANFAYCLSMLGDYSDIRIQQLEGSVISELMQYKILCKNAKDDVKHIFNVRDRELARRRQLERIREKNPRNRQQIAQAETKLLKATADVSRTIHNLEEETNAFERRKLHDAKNVLLKFITIEMAFHAKTLEALSKVYDQVSDIDEDSDLQDLQNYLKSTDKNSYLSGKRKTFKSSQSLGSLESTPNKQKGNLKRHGSSQHITGSNNTLESINDNTITQSAETLNDSDSENSAASNITNKFVIKKHKNQRK